MNERGGAGKERLSFEVCQARLDASDKIAFRCTLQKWALSSMEVEGRAH